MGEGRAVVADARDVLGAALLVLVRCTVTMGAVLLLCLCGGSGPGEGAAAAASNNRFAEATGHLNLCSSASDRTAVFSLPDTAPLPSARPPPPSARKLTLGTKSTSLLETAAVQGGPSIADCCHADGTPRQECTGRQPPVMCAALES
eukprot:jgi/Ulvmu1/11077/UM007_0259.1